MNAHRLSALLALSTLIPQLSTQARAGTSLEPGSGMAWSASTGWLDPRAGDGTRGLIIGQCVCAGFFYSANCGWINMGSGQPANGAQYTNTTGADSGVNRLPDGRLRGLAWGAGIGWINFEDTGNPLIDPATRQLLGYAWSAGTGWISLANTSGAILQQESDADHDGLPDAWENEWSTPDMLTAAGDLDHDGQSDAAEYAAGTDPTEAYSKLILVNFAPGANTASLTWASVPGRNYRVQVSSDLVNWSYTNFLVIPPANPLISAGSAGATTTHTVLKPAGPRQFFRIIALKPPV